MLMKYENGFENSIREFRHGCAHTNSQNRHLLFADCPCSDIKRSELTDWFRLFDPVSGCALTPAEEHRMSRH